MLYRHVANTVYKYLTYLFTFAVVCPRISLFPGQLHATLAVKSYDIVHQRNPRQLNCEHTFVYVIT